MMMVLPFQDEKGMCNIIEHRMQMQCRVSELQPKKTHINMEDVIMAEGTCEEPKMVDENASELEPFRDMLRGRMSLNCWSSFDEMDCASPRRRGLHLSRIAAETALVVVRHLAFHPAFLGTNAVMVAGSFSLWLAEIHACLRDETREEPKWVPQDIDIFFASGAVDPGMIEHFKNMEWKQQNLCLVTKESTGHRIKKDSDWWKCDLDTVWNKCESHLAPGRSYESDSRAWWLESSNAVHAIALAKKTCGEESQGRYFHSDITPRAALELLYAWWPRMRFSFIVREDVVDMEEFVNNYFDFSMCKWCISLCEKEDITLIPPTSVSDQLEWAKRECVMHVRKGMETYMMVSGRYAPERPELEDGTLYSLQPEEIEFDERMSKYKERGFTITHFRISPEQAWCKGPMTTVPNRMELKPVPDRPVSRGLKRWIVGTTEKHTVSRQPHETEASSFSAGVELMNMGDQVREIPLWRNWIHAHIHQAHFIWRWCVGDRIDQRPWFQDGVFFADVTRYIANTGHFNWLMCEGRKVDHPTLDRPQTVRSAHLQVKRLDHLQQGIQREMSTERPVHEWEQIRYDVLELLSYSPLVMDPLQRWTWFGWSYLIWLVDLKGRHDQAPPHIQYTRVDGDWDGTLWQSAEYMLSETSESMIIYKDAEDDGDVLLKTYAELVNRSSVKEKQMAFRRFEDSIPKLQALARRFTGHWVELFPVIQHWTLNKLERVFGSFRRVPIRQSDLRAALQTHSVTLVQWMLEHFLQKQPYTTKDQHVSAWTLLDAIETSNVDVLRIVRAHYTGPITRKLIQAAEQTKDEDILSVFIVDEESD
jgi:hypothetical protein